MWDKQIPYIAYESEMARHERTIKRLLIALIVAIVMLFASNVAWLFFFNQFDYASNSVSQGTTVRGAKSSVLPTEWSRCKEKIAETQ